MLKTGEKGRIGGRNEDYVDLTGFSIVDIR
jgi:hypothetical protein